MTGALRCTLERVFTSSKHRASPEQRTNVIYNIPIAHGNMLLK